MKRENMLGLISFLKFEVLGGLAQKAPLNMAIFTTNCHSQAIY
jgi:hypothetical protein